MRTTLLPLSLGCLLLAAGCNCGDNTVTPDSGAANADSGFTGTGSDSGVIVSGDGGVDRVALTITIVGEGAVASDGVAICSSATDPCVLNFAAGSTPTATATPAEGYTFTSWSCSGTVSTTATLQLRSTSQTAACTVTFTKVSETLHLSVTEGRGTVTATPGGLSCGTQCDGAVDWGTEVTLKATPDAQYHFVGWAGDCAGRAGSTITITVTSATSCSASFATGQFALTLSVLGSGTLAASNAGNSLTTCAQAVCVPVNVDAAISVLLTATPAAGFEVGDWSGDCTGASGAASTSLVMNAAKTCTCRFVKVVTPVNVTVKGVSGGNGTVAPASTVIVSGGAGALLTSTPNAGFALSGWSGAFTTGSGTATGCSGTTSPVTVDITGATTDAVYTCTATFAAKHHTLTVLNVAEGESFSTVAGPGTISGTLTCSASQCTVEVNEGDAISLTATALVDASKGADFEFINWSDCVTGSTTALITVGMGTSNLTCRASYRRFWARAFGTDEQTTSGWSPVYDDVATSIVATASSLAMTASHAVAGKPSTTSLLRLPPWGDLAGAGSSTEYFINGPDARVDLLDVMRAGTEGLALSGSVVGDFGNGIEVAPTMLFFSDSTPSPSADPKLAMAYPISKAVPPPSRVVDSCSYDALGSNGYAFAGTMATPNGPTYGRVLALDRSGGIRFDRLFCQAQNSSCKGCVPNTNVTAIDGSSDGKLLVVVGVGTVPYIAFFDDAGNLVSLRTLALDPKFFSSFSLSDVVIAEDDRSAIVLGSGFDVTLQKATLIAARISVDVGSNFDWATQYAQPAGVSSVFGSSIIRQGKIYLIAGGANVTSPAYGIEGVLLRIDKSGAIIDIDARANQGVMRNYGAGGPTHETFTSVANVPFGGIALAGTTLSFGLTPGPNGTNNSETDAWALRVRDTGQLTFNTASGAHQQSIPLTETAVTITIPLRQACADAVLALADDAFNAAAVVVSVSANGKLATQQATQCGPTDHDTIY